MSHEGRDLMVEIAGQGIVLEQDTFLERLMPTLDLALGLRVIWRCGRAVFSACSGTAGILCSGP
jgi:hypothetical protein